jgi:transposase
MMGNQEGFQPKLFYHQINLDQRVPQGHILRKIQEKIDFDFIYGEVKDTDGDNGNISIPPPVILKMMLLLILYNVRSERELMETIPLRLDWLWFLGYDLDSEVADHSVLSKARARWGVEAFRNFFERIVWQCVEAGLVDGKKLFVDSSLIDANASNNSVVDRHSLRRYLSKSYRRLEGRLDEVMEQKRAPVESRYISTTDPGASVVRQGGKPKLRYKTHRSVDAKHEVITATQLTPGSRDEGDLLGKMIEVHEQNVRKKVGTVVADSRYGKIDNFLFCHDLGIKAHIPSLEETQRGYGRKRGIFPREAFTYDPERDVFCCPAGQTLKRTSLNRVRNHYEYRIDGEICAGCKLQAKCTHAKEGRTLKRHLRQDELDKMLIEAKSREAKADLKMRQHLSERSFAQSHRYGYKRARWHELGRVQIQDYLIAAVQNIQILMDHLKGHAISVAKRVREQVTPTFERQKYSFWSILNIFSARWNTYSPFGEREFCASNLSLCC